jgi:predicted amidophosphoribosyltransferase
MDEWLTCPDCGNDWPRKDTLYCPVCNTKGEADEPTE